MSHCTSFILSRSIKYHLTKHTLLDARITKIASYKVTTFFNSSNQSNNTLPQNKRCFSDNLVGYSPMANNPPPKKNTVPNPGKSGPSWGVDANTAGGGVWAQTSAKREKLAELKTEAKEGMKSLDEMATEDQKMELYFADGIRLVARAIDEAWEFQSLRKDVALPVKEVEEWLSSTENGTARDLNQVEFEAHLGEVIQKLTPHIHPLETYSSSLLFLRDFVEPKTETSPTPTSSSTISMAFDNCVLLYKLSLLQNTAEVLKSNWDVLTAVTDSDVDRAAVRGEDIFPSKTLSIRKVNDVLRAHAFGTCSDRFSAFWKLMDKDDDGMMDQEEMNTIVSLSMKPVEETLKTFFDQSIQAYPITSPLPPLDQPIDLLPKTKPTTSWRQRRKEKKQIKKLTKLFHTAIKRHFDIEVETPHRLRCIYTWAEKSHQDNKIDSVLVDSSSDAEKNILTGKKRYVELHPKISLEEFRTEQQQHFSHLDRVGEEIMTSFREDLLVKQGKGRQNRELMRDCALFFTVVSLIDLGIIWT